MTCPLMLYPGSTSGTVQYYVTGCPCCCGCGLKLCDFHKCKYMQKGFVIQIGSLGATGTDTAVILGQCGGTLPLYAESTGDAVTVAQLTANSLFRVYVSWVNGIPKGIVGGL